MQISSVFVILKAMLSNDDIFPEIVPSFILLLA